MGSHRPGTCEPLLSLKLEVRTHAAGTHSSGRGSTGVLSAADWEEEAFSFWGTVFDVFIIFGFKEGDKDLMIFKKNFAEKNHRSTNELKRDEKELIKFGRLKT